MSEKLCANCASELLPRCMCDEEGIAKLAENDSMLATFTRYFLQTKDTKLAAVFTRAEHGKGLQ